MGYKNPGIFHDSAYDTMKKWYKVNLKSQLIDCTYTVFRQSEEQAIEDAKNHLLRASYTTEEINECSIHVEEGPLDAI